MKRALACLCLSLATLTAFAAEPASGDAKSETKSVAKSDAKTTPADAKKVAPTGDMVLSGLSILGNDETPKELVIVPWKSSQLADAPGISRLLDDSTQPVDKDVFMREFEYFKFKSDDSGSD